MPDQVNFNECPVGREVSLNLAIMQIKQEEIHESVSKIEKSLLGNGREGLVVKVAKLAVRMKIVYSILGALGAWALISLGGMLLS